ncbi:MAG: conserved protein, permease-related protein [delta proteobacterium ML8_F1]|nr:MAG: conserved protein, permease-related protein [delta proteobacterium ML8_F1]
MAGLYVFTGIALGVSFFFDRDKTRLGLKKGMMKLGKTMPKYLKLLMIISFVLLLSEDLIIETLGQERTLTGLFFSLVLGSLTMMPGFIAYPLAKILVARGVSYMVVAGFVTSLMLVGIVTYPLEKEYFGQKATILRNLVGFFIAAAIALITGMLYGEVTLW